MKAMVQPSPAWRSYAESPLRGSGNALKRAVSSSTPAARRGKPSELHVAGMAKVLEHFAGLAAAILSRIASGNAVKEQRLIVCRHMLR